MKYKLVKLAFKVSDMANKASNVNILNGVEKNIFGEYYVMG